MVLIVQYTDCYSIPTGEVYPYSWCVVNPGEIIDSQPACVMHGFARRVDAELAAQSLEKAGINWQGTSEEIQREWDEFGGRDEMEKVAFGALQW